MCNCGNEPLYLRENSQPDNPDYNVGVKKGTTVSNKSCFSCQDKTVVYYSETGEKGHTLRLDCCELLKLSIPCFCTRCKDINISIENKDGLVVGNILVPNGFCSAKVDSMCQVPGTYFEINFPQNISALEKFQIITEAVHYDIADYKTPDIDCYRPELSTKRPQGVDAVPIKGRTTHKRSRLWQMNTGK